MMRILFVFLILLASVWAGVKLHHDPGYVFVSFNHWTLETTLWVGLACLLLGFFLLYFLLRLWSKLIHLPETWHQWRTNKQIQQAQTRTQQGLIEFSEGHWQSAKNHLIKALPNADTPLLNYLTAARAAQELGDNKLRDDYLRQAQQSMPEAKMAVELTQAQLQLSNHQWEQALATLRHLQDLAPRHPYVLKLLMQLYEQIADWPQFIDLLPTLKRQHVLSEAEFTATQKQVYQQQLIHLTLHHSAEAIKQFMEKLPKKLNEDPEINSVYCQYLLKQHDNKQAEARLRRCMNKKMDPELLDIYGQLAPDIAQLSFIENLKKKHPHSGPLYLCLARISAGRKLWGKAREYFESALNLYATPTLYLEYGQLLEQLNETQDACTAYRQGLICAASWKSYAKEHHAHQPHCHFPTER